MRRRNGFLAGLVVLFAAADTAEGADWGSLPYFSPSTSTAYIATDGSWDGARVQRFGAALSLAPYASNAFPSPIPREFIWGPSCGRALERRTFTKVVELPGVPANGRVSLAYAPGRDRPYDGALLSVNGVGVAKLTRTAGSNGRRPPQISGDLSALALQAFRPGTNTLRLDVTKTRLPRGQRCRSEDPFRRVGIEGDLELHFASELVATQPQIPLEVLRNVTNGQRVGVEGRLTITNLGPSTALASQIYATVGGDGEALFVPQISVASAPVSACTVDSDGLTCDVPELAAGQSASVPVLAGLVVNTSFFRNGAGRMRISVSALGRGQIANPAFQQEKVIVLCTASATDPACR